MRRDVACDDLPHLTWVRRLARLAQVPLALNNARRTARMRSTSARKSAARITGRPVIAITRQ
jgi:hypothetical protein